MVTYYQVDFVAGDPIKELGEDGLYAEQDRLLRFAFGSADEGITEKGTASVTFTVADDCEGVTLSLVTYSMPADEFSMETADEQVLLNRVTDTYDPREHTSRVQLPTP